MQICVILIMVYLPIRLEAQVFFEQTVSKV